VSLPRLVLVLPGGAGRLTSPFYTVSFAVHALVLVALLVAPSFRRHRPVFDDAMVVDVVGSLPGGPPPPAKAAPPPKPAEPKLAPAPKKEKEGARATDNPVLPRDPTKQKPPKKEEPKKKEEEPDVEPGDAAPATGPVTGPAAPTKTPPGTGALAGGITSLDASDLEFAWYRAQITSALKGRWVRPILDDVTGTIAATVVFDIGRDGSVTGVRIESTSGVAVMDRSVLRAVLEAAPLPGLPASFQDSVLSARYEFRFQPGEP